MGWVRVDDSFYDNDKFYNVTALGVAMFVAALAWSNRNLTDGFVPERAAQIIVNFEGLAYGREDELASPIHYGDAITELINAGVLEAVDGGYQIVNYLKFQPSAKSVLAEREAARERMAKARSKRFGGSSGEQSPKFGEGSGEVRVTPTPTPTPNPESQERDARTRAPARLRSDPRPARMGRHGDPCLADRRRDAEVPRPLHRQRQAHEGLERRVA